MKFCFCSVDSFRALAAANHLSESFQLRMLLHLQGTNSKHSQTTIKGDAEQARRKEAAVGTSCMVHAHAYSC